MRGCCWELKLCTWFCRLTHCPGGIKVVLLVRGDVWKSVAGFFHYSLIWVCCLARDWISKRTKGCVSTATVKRLEFILCSWWVYSVPFHLFLGFLRRRTGTEAVMGDGHARDICHTYPSQLIVVSYQLDAYSPWNLQQKTSAFSNGWDIGLLISLPF